MLCRFVFDPIMERMESEQTGKVALPDAAASAHDTSIARKYAIIATNGIENAVIMCLPINIDGG